MADPTIRAATADDVPAIRALARRCWETTYDDVLGDETIDACLDAWYGAETLRESVAEAETTYLVADDADRDGGDGNGDLVGYVYGGPHDDGAAALSMLYVHPDRWGQGIGSDLLAAFESFCREADCRVVDVEVLADNDVGRSFYRKHGYEVLGEGESDLFGETVRGCLVRGHLD